MADDASYNTFLTKANLDPKSGDGSETQSTSQARSRFDPTTSSSGTDPSALPASLRDLPSTQYVSDTDSDFEPVFFSYASEDLPSVEDFKHILAKQAKEGKVEQLSIKDFDPRGEYEEIVSRVRDASGQEKRGKEGDGSIVVFRVQISGTRVEYYVLTVGERKLVGVVTKAVES